MSDNINEEGWFPSTIGSQVEVLYWTSSEMVIPITLVAWSAFAHQFLLAVVLFISYCWLYSKYQHKFPKGFAQNLLYACGLLKYSNIPTIFATRFRE